MSIESIRAALELTTGQKWSPHRPQSRSMIHIVAVDEDGFIKQYIAERFYNEDDALFVVTLKNELPELLAEMDEAMLALAEIRRLYGPDWQAEIKQFEEVVKTV